MARIDWLSLENKIDECMLADKSKLRRRVKQLDKAVGQKSTKAAERLVRDIEKSRYWRTERARNLPIIRYPNGLPVSDRRREVTALIKNHQVSIVCGETGSGKTTQIPKMCLELGRGVEGFIGHTQPRRLAARSVATRLGNELGNEHYVGCKVRFRDSVTAHTYVKVMTDGILLAELSSDRWLEQYDTLIIDEAHERSLNIDFILGYLKKTLSRRPDLKVIITSATINAQKFSTHFDAAPVIEISGRGFPIDLEYRALEQDEEGVADLNASVGKAIQSLAGKKAGDVLVFLSGEREIHETAEALPISVKDKFEIIPLYARLERAAQDRVFAKGQRQKLILATNVAETSLTIPNIGYVIDSGRVRISRYSHRNKIQHLPIEVISQASASQRMGRCGRTGPGTCIRFYAQSDYELWPEFTEPEVRRTNLASVILRMKTLALGDTERFPFIDPPDRRYVKDGLRLLRELSALDESDRLVPLGRELVKFPVDSRISRMILAASDQQCLAEVLVIASALSIQDPFERPRARREEASRAREPFTDQRSDFLTYVNVWHFLRSQTKQHSRSTVRRLCAKYFVSWQRFREWEDVHYQLAEIARNLDFRTNPWPADYAQVHRALLYGSLGLVGKWNVANTYDGARGSQFQISPACVLYRRKPSWMMAAELVETTRIYAHRGARIRPEWIETVAPDFLLNRGYSEPLYDSRKGRIFAQERVTVYGLPIISKRRRAFDEVDSVECRKLFIANALVEGKLRTDGKFLLHNQGVVDGLRALEHKTRRSEMLEDDATIADLYALRIPKDITRAASFERWRRRIERSDPYHLHFNEQALKRDDAPILDATDFPDYVDVDGHRFPLKYRFDPGAQDDGITVTIPLLLINQLPAGVFEWLVPGRLHEKILALLRVLPKTLRRNFVPAPDFARRCFAAFAQRSATPARLGLHIELANQLEQMNGTGIADAAWNVEKLPQHLLMNFEVIDADHSIVGKGRNLKGLREMFGARAAGGFEQLTPKDLRRDELKTWPDVLLPTTYRFEHAGLELQGYPAMIDQGDAIGVRLFDTRSRAEREGAGGLYRLLQLTLRRELKTKQQFLPNIDRLKLLYICVMAPLPIHCFTTRSYFSGPLDKEIMRRGVEHCFQFNPTSTRDKPQFTHWIETGWTSLDSFLDKLCEKLDEVLALHHRIRVQIQERRHKGLDDNLNDIESHLERLIFRGFLSEIPLGRLDSYPRYLSAVERRIEKLTSASRKDRRRSLNLRTLWERCQRILSPLPIARREAADVQHIRWMLEELSVATFAQDLGTGQTVSVERVEAALEDVEA